jgi:multiple antibiotic resistance protein
MSDPIRFGILAFTSLLAIVNPLSVIPMYVAMTLNYDREHRIATLRRAIVTGFSIMVAFALLGGLILRFFGITTPAFQIAGGIIFFGIGWDMLQAKRSAVKTTEEEEAYGAAKEDVGIIPLGMPGLVGPGTITTVIALQSQAQSLAHRAAIYVSIVLVTIISWLVLAGAPAVIRRMGPTGMNVFTRLMGLFTMVLGAQFVINGLSTVFPGLLVKG